MPDKPTEECGVFGVFGNSRAAQLTYLGIYALQHRGQESAGITTSDGKRIYFHRGMGLVNDVFNEKILDRLPGYIASGHVRYSTAGLSNIANAQPFVVQYVRGGLTIAHNGNLINAIEQREKLEKEGAIFQSSMDTEVIVHLIARSKRENFEDAVIEALKQIKGSYSLLIMNENKLIGIRDPHGFRPLCLGKLGDSYIFSSETCALDLIEAEFIREINPGEVLVIDKNGMNSITPFTQVQHSHCMFEYIYFARPDSNVFGQNVHLVRKALGKELALEFGVEADIVIGIPDSGLSASLGYSEQSGIPFDYGLIRNHYVGRTFIQPTQILRNIGVGIKLNPVKEVLSGKRVIVIDDSLVRGTTSRKIVRFLRNSGAREVHFRISSPPIKFPCFYGIDTPMQEELIASNHEIENIRQYLNVETLRYLSIEGMLKACGPKHHNFCLACFNGQYPVKINKNNCNNSNRKNDRINVLIEEQLEF
ncbi:MAG: amidophosphoribosyltransferase [Candidatus Firestonebacteria bacterium]|nr:amidophosphoribosyltransferase [Candidatus Firestonebacteria bacterium]